MKRVSSFIIAIITLISLTVPAFADSSDYISDPELRAEYQRQMEEYDRLIAERDALRVQFQKDNPGVSEYFLNGVSFSSELFYDIFYDASLFNHALAGTGHRIFREREKKTCSVPRTFRRKDYFGKVYG